MRIRGVPCRDGLGVDEGKERRAVHPFPCEIDRRLVEADRVGLAAEGLVLDATGEDELVHRDDRAGSHPGRVLQLGCDAQHHSGRDRLVGVRQNPEPGELFQEVRRRARLAQFPLGATTTSLAQKRADLADSVLDAGRLEPHALHRDTVRAGPRAEVDGKATGGIGEELAARGTWLVDVRVLRELADHSQAAARLPRVFSRCSGSTLTSARTGMKFVSPVQRGTTCWCRCAAIDPPAIAPRFSPTLNPSGA